MSFKEFLEKEKTRFAERREERNKVREEERLVYEKAYHESRKRALMKAGRTQGYKSVTGNEGFYRKQFGSRLQHAGQSLLAGNAEFGEHAKKRKSMYG